MQSAARTKAERDSLLAMLLAWISFGEKAPLLKPQTRLLATSRLVRESESLARWCVKGAPNDPLPQPDLGMVDSLVSRDIKVKYKPNPKQFRKALVEENA